MGRGPGSGVHKSGRLHAWRSGRARPRLVGGGAPALAAAWSPLLAVAARRQEAFLAAFLAAASAALLRFLVPVGIDTAAQLYQTGRFLHAGFQFWDNYWYDGRYSFIDYSLIYFPLASLIGEVPTVLGTLAASGYLFARLVAGRFGVTGRWAVRSFAICAGVVVWISGEYPFALGMALGLLALTLRNHRRLPLAGLAALAALLASPLAFLLLLVAAVGIAVGSGSVRALLRRPDILLGLLICLAVGGALELAFPVGGSFHFNFWSLFQVLALAALAFACSWRLQGVGVIRGVFAAAALAATVSYLISSPLGGNASRLVDYVGGPLILILLAKQLREGRMGRPLALGVGALAVCGQLAPNLVTAAVVLNVRAAEPVFWRGAIAFLRAHANPDFRVEAVDTSGHWEAYYLPAAGIPIVRGWFRQDDFPDNALLYHPFGPPLYRQWLRRSGVRYVVLPHTTLDYSAVREGRLLASGRSGLKVVFANQYTTIYEADHPVPILVAPPGERASVLYFGHASLDLWLGGPGRYRLAINYTPYWHLTPRGVACLRKGGEGFTVVEATSKAVLRLRFDPTIPRLLEGGRELCPAS